MKSDRHQRDPRGLTGVPSRRRRAEAVLTTILWLALASAAALRAQAIEQFSAGGGCGPWGIAAGPDDNLWLTCGSSNQVEKISPAGSVLGTFTLQHPGSYPVGIATGPDGNVWFGEHDGNRIARITPAGVITEFDLPNPGSGIVGVAPGSDGNVWFTEQQGHRVGKITPTGTITEYTDTGNPGMTPGLLALGPDGNLWIDEGTNNVIAKVTPSGVFTDYAAPSATSIGGIANGADGYLWFVEDGADKVARIRASDGHIDEFGPFPGESGFGDIAHGADGRIWVDEREHSKLLRLHASGVLQAVFTVANDAWNGIAGPDGNVWFINGFADAVTRVDTATGFEDFPIPCTSGEGGLTVEALPDGSVWGALQTSTSSDTQMVHFQMPDLVPHFFDSGTNGSELGNWGHSLAVDSSGNLWYPDAASNSIVEMTGDLVHSYAIPTPSCDPWSVALGSDGNIWFTELFGAKIGRLTSQGAVSEFGIPGNSAPLAIVAGPDGNLWFTDRSGPSVGRLTTDGVVTEFPDQMQDSPLEITADASALWFTSEDLDFGRITTDGSVTAIATNRYLYGAASDGHGAIWLTEPFSGHLLESRSVTGAARDRLTPWHLDHHVSASPVSGLWYGSAEGLCSGFLCCDSTHPAIFGHLRREIFGDGFESGDLWRWSTRSF